MIRYEINLWDGKAAKQIWTGTTFAINKHEMLSEAHSAAHSTVKTLIKEKMLKPTL